jgi:hypothetical protein
VRPAPAQPRPAAGQPHPFARGAKASANVTEDRLRELHSKLSEAKRKTNDRTNVSVEGLRKSLQSAEAKLRSKHGAHRKVDFDVVIKNGKAVLKPVVK